MSTKSVHVPECDNPLCEKSLSHLNGEYQSLGFKTVAYPSFGLFSKHFNENYKQCTYTTIHKCPKLWKLINTDGIDISSLNKSEKLAVISFSAEVEPDNGDTSWSAAFDDYFKCYRIQDASDENKINSFIKRKTSIAPVRNESHASTDKKGPDVAPRSRNGATDPKFVYSEKLHSYANSTFDEKDVVKKLHDLRQGEARKSDNWQMSPYPDEFGHSSSQSVMARSHDNENLLALDDITTFTELKDLVNVVLDDSVRALPNAKFILQKVLPELNNSNQVYGILIFATCADRVTQKHAISLLELLLLRGRLAAPQVHMTVLKNMQTKLLENICTIASIRSLSPQSWSEKLEVILKRKCCLLLMLQGEMIMACQGIEDIRSCETFNKYIKSTIETGNKKLKSSDHVDCVKIFLELPLDQVQKCTTSFITKITTEKFSVTASGLKIEFYYVFQLFKKIFSSSDSQAINILKAHREMKSKLLWKQSSSTAIELILRGFSHFLNYSSKESSSQSLDTLCTEITQIIIANKEKDQRTFNDVIPILRALMFRPTPAIRQCAIDLFKGLDSNPESFRIHLLDAITHFLSPVLVPDKSYTRTLQHEKSQNGWFKVSGNFSGYQTIISFHVPHEKDHREINKSDLNDSPQFQQISVLKELMHDNIATLFAYNIYHIPQFYVMEEGRNLQEQLVNRSINKTYFSEATLYSCLNQAAAAVEYCHSKNIVHCNITTASFLLVDSQKLKLSGFHLSFALKSNENEKIYDSEDSIIFREIPTLWSAPESLRRCRFSRQTDIWMIGHMFYEIVTHGLLPYSQLGLSDANVLLGVFKSAYQLRHESCIEEELFEHVILPCVCVDPYQRPSLSLLQKRLFDCQKRHESTKYSELNYPDLKQNPNKPSTEYTKTIAKKLSTSLHHLTSQIYKGLPAVNYEYFSGSNKEYKKHTDDLELFELPSKEYLLKQHVKGPLSKQLLEEIGTGTLDDVWPFISFFRAQGNKYTIEILMPFPYVGNVLELVMKKEIAKTEAELQKLLFEIAKMMKRLHESNFLVGDLRASQLYVENVTGGFKIHPIFLPHLMFTKDKTSSLPCNPPTDPVALARAAPEVKQSGSYSHASDIFCFGVLIWDLKEANSCDIAPYHINIHQRKGSQSWADELESKVNPIDSRRPNDMSNMLFQLMRQCLNLVDTSRPSMQNILRVLSPNNRYCDDYLASKTSDYFSMGSDIGSDSALLAKDVRKGPRRLGGDWLNVINKSSLTQSIEDARVNRERTSQDLNPAYNEADHYEQLLSGEYMMETSFNEFCQNSASATQDSSVNDLSSVYGTHDYENSLSSYSDIDLCLPPLSDLGPPPLPYRGPPRLPYRGPPHLPDIGPPPLPARNYSLQVLRQPPITSAHMKKLEGETSRPVLPPTKHLGQGAQDTSVKRLSSFYASLGTSESSEASNLNTALIPPPLPDRKYSTLNFPATSKKKLGSETSGSNFSNPVLPATTRMLSDNLYSYNELNDSQSESKYEEFHQTLPKEILESRPAEDFSPSIDEKEIDQAYCELFPFLKPS